VLEDGFGPELALEQGDLLLGAGVDAVEDALAQRPVVRVERQQTRPDGADGHARDVGARVGRAVQQRPADRHQVVPPHPVGVVLGPAGTRQLEAVLDRVLAQHRPVGAHQHALRRVGPDIDAEQELAHERASHDTRPQRCTRMPMAANAAALAASARSAAAASGA
jgi:hypothetical protein